MLFVSILLDMPSVNECSKNVKFIVGFTSLLPGIIILLIAICLAIILSLFLEWIVHILKTNIILPIMNKDIKKISLLLLVTWSSLLFWSIILFEGDNVAFVLGLFQIFFTIVSIVFMSKNDMTKFRYNLNIVIIFGVTIFFVDIFKNKNGLTTFGIISFLSITFYPTYFILKKTKKIYKKYLENKTLQHNMMPREPPAIYACGNIELYKNIYAASTPH